MTIASYAGLKERFELLDFTLSPTTGGSTTASTSFYYFAYGITRSGINKGTALGQVAIEAGERLEFTINTTARPNGLQPFGFALGAATTNDETQSKLLGVAWVIEDDQETNINLPLTLIFDSDEDLAINGTITAIEDLPSNPVNGCIRYVSNESAYYQWDDGFYGDPSWIQVYGDQLYLTNTTDLRSGLKWKGGCDTPINSIPPDPQPNYYGIISPLWGGEGGISTPIKLWLLRGLTEGNGVVSPVDSQISLVALLNDNSELAASELSGKIELIINNYIRRSTGAITTAIGESATWSSGTPFYFLEQQLDQGYVLEVEYTCSATIGNGDRFVAYLRDDGVFGIPTNQIAIGSSAYVNGKKSLIVPDTLGVKRLSGKGLVVTSNQSLGYQWNCNGETGLTQGIIADTANQKIAISGIRNGAIACYQPSAPLLSTEALRAIISTESGTATASDWTAPVTVGTNGRIEVAIALPTAIRDNYPDTLIAGSTDGERVIPQMRVFVRVLGIITEIASVTVEADNEQILIISDLSSGAVVGSLPSNDDASFNLWSYGAMIPTATGTGSLTAGDYEIAIAWHYPSPNLGITKISHDINDGCIPTLPLSLADAIALSSIYSQLQVQGVNAAQRQILDLDSRLVETADDPSNNRLRVQLPDVAKTIVTTTNPGVTDDVDNGYRVGDIWINTDSSPAGFYIAEDVTVGAAVWTVLGGGGSGSGITPIADIIALKARTGVNNNANYLLKTNNSIYRYDADSTADNDNNTVIVPDDKIDPPSPGRFLKTGSYNADEITETSRKFATQAQLDAIVSNTTALGTKSDTDHTHVTELNGILTGNGSNQQTLLFPTGVTDRKYLSSQGSGIEWTDAPNAIDTKTTAGYVQPAIDATVVINFGSTANFVVNQTYIVIEAGGLYLITAIGGLTTATAKYLGFGANPTISIATNKKVSLSGKPGENGSSSITTVITDFTVPGVDSTVIIEVGSANGINLDSFINIESAGNYQVAAKDIISNPNTLTALNLGGDNTSPGATIANGSQVIISGKPGPTGAASAASSFVFDSAIAPPSTGQGETKDFVDSLNGNKRSTRKENNGTILVYAYESTSFPQLFLESENQPTTGASQRALWFDGTNVFFRRENDGVSDRILTTKDYGTTNLYEEEIINRWL